MVTIHEVCCKYGTEYDIEDSLLVAHGYKSNPKEHDKTAVLARLKAMSEIPSMYEDELILWWEHEENPLQPYHGIYLVSPVLMALLLKEYELAEKLIDQGYDANDFQCEEQVYVEIDCGIKTSCISLYISQILMSQFDMPESLFRKLADAQIRDNFDFFIDYWYNPFLLTTEELLQREKFPSTQGFHVLRDYEPELLYYAMGDTTQLITNNFRYLDYEEWKAWIRELTGLFEGMPENMVNLHRSVMSFVDYGNGRWNQKKVIDGLYFACQMLPEFFRFCDGDIDSKKILYMSAFQAYRHIEDGSYQIPQGCRKNLLKRLNNFLLEHCPEWYSQEVFLEECSKNIDWAGYADWMRIWKKCLNRTIQIDLKESNFLNLLGVILGIDLESMHPYRGNKIYDLSYDNERIGLAEMRISEAIRCLEQVDSMEGEMDAESASNLFALMMRLGSEELMLLSLQKGMFTEKMIPTLTQAALLYQGERFLPMLLLYGNQKK